MRDAQNLDVLEQRQESTTKKPLLLALSVAAVVALIDQVTKRWALSALESGPCSEPGNCIDLFAGIKFNLVFNTGAAFTRGSGLGPLLAVIAFFMTGFLIYLATRRTDRLGVMLFGTIAGGAVGNLIDRIYRADDGPLSGAVVDFIDLGWWPVFNIADSAIVVGVIAVIIMTLFEETNEADDGAGGDQPADDDSGDAVDDDHAADAEVDRSDALDDPNPGDPNSGELTSADDVEADRSTGDVIDRVE